VIIHSVDRECRQATRHRRRADLSTVRPHDVDGSRRSCSPPAVFERRQVFDLSRSASSSLPDTIRARHGLVDRAADRFRFRAAAHRRAGRIPALLTPRPPALLSRRPARRNPSRALALAGEPFAHAVLRELDVARYGYPSSSRCSCSTSPSRRRPPGLRGIPGRRRQRAGPLLRDIDLATELDRSASSSSCRTPIALRPTSRAGSSVLSLRRCGEHRRAIFPRA